MTRPYRWTKEGLARRRERSSERMKALHADPKFAKAHSERMKALHADPEFNPLAALTPQERALYDVLKKAGYSRADALVAVGRGDLAHKRRAT